MIMFLSVLTIVVAILLIVIVMVQNPKGGGLSSTFGGGGTQLLGGVKKSTDFLDRATWTLAIALVVLSIGINLYTGGFDEEGIETRSEITDSNLPISAPAPTQAPIGGDNNFEE